MSKILKNKWTVCGLVVVAMGTVAHAVVEPLAGLAGARSLSQTIDEQLVWDDNSTTEVAEVQPSRSMDVAALEARYGRARDPFAAIPKVASPSKEAVEAPGTASLPDALAREKNVEPEPLRPIVLQVPESDEAVRKAMEQPVPPPPSVSAIMLGGRTSVAVIGGTLSQVGTRIGSYVVTSIDEHNVQMDGPDGVVTVGLSAAFEPPGTVSGRNQ